MIKGDEGDHERFEGLVDHTLQSEEVDVETQDVDTVDTPPWLKMPKEDDTSNVVKHIELKKRVTKMLTPSTPPKLRMPKEDDTSNGVKVGDEHQMNALGSEVNVELEKSIDMLEKFRLV
ncbi:uncharacterized protein E6C27_scaffold79G00630 [Cucumis melo var. makuwa]|uniref:Uncharacterized protein n=1 Tax=Cucumis melo var. makuwa TaxID=1194695 RepID=A0A5A7V9M4_CUCMM|nr:uncharacterized protein E6C27_scaffold79G00630 [Cucumis melo var. makuwa]